MNQNFNSEQLLKLCKKYEIRLAGKIDLSKIIDANFDAIVAGDFHFKMIKKHDLILINYEERTKEYIASRLLLRKLNDNINRIYKEKQSNRQSIIYQMKILMEEDSPKWIIRTDIKEFYESINRELLVQKFSDDCMLSYYSMELLRVLFNDTPIKNESGLPRGLSISSTMSEIYLRRFDKQVKRHEGVYYYARFVDDIIIFCSSEKNAKILFDSIPCWLSEDGLTLNKDKTDLLDDKKLSEGNSLEYLGYKFYYNVINKKQKLVASIADKKLKKIKHRLVLSFANYAKNSDNKLLEERIRFLTCNYCIKKSGDKKNLKAGIYYNYMFITDKSVLDKLYIFYWRLLNSHRGAFGKKLDATIDSDFRKKLTKYSFRHGFEKRICYSFDAKKLSLIKKCWNE
jgi:hypothetical protein